MSYELYDYQQKLVDRTRKAFIDGYKSPLIVSPAGSGKTIVISDIVKSATHKKNKVLFLVHREEILEQVRITLINNSVDMNYVQLGMVQTVVNRLDETPTPTLVVIDESHNALSNSYLKIIDHFNHAKLVSFTATPVRFGGVGLGDINDILIEEVTVKDLIEKKFLAPYKYYAPKLIDTEKLKISSIKEFSKQSIDDAMDKQVIYGDAVKHYKKLAKGEQAIVYAHSVESSKEVAETFNDNGINAKHIDGNTPKHERDEIIERFRDGDIKLISNVNIISEGADFPNCSVVIMLRPTESLSLFIQQSMRGMRYRPHKISIIIDHVDNVSRHGLPDDEREWSLSSAKKSESENEIKIKECENCFAVYAPEYIVCPMCGHKPEVVEAAEYEVDDSAELEEVTESPIKLNFESLKEPSECQSMKELIELGKARGYAKPSGWAWHQSRLHGIKK